MRHDPIEVSIADRDGSSVMVGLLHPQPRGGAMFQYDGAWISRRDAYEISPELPLRTGSQHLAADRGRLPQAFSDSAPDRWGRGVIQRAWKLQGLGIPSEVDYLLEVNDRLRMGALRYGRAGQIMTLDSRVPKSIDLAALEAASRRTERADETDADVAALMHAGSSLGALSDRARSGLRLRPLTSPLRGHRSTVRPHCRLIC